MCLAGRCNEAEGPTFAVAACMEFGREAAARAAERLGVPSLLFTPAAQW
jgi:hypothetical protein